MHSHQALTAPAVLKPFYERLDALPRNEYGDSIAMAAAIIGFAALVLATAKQAHADCEDSVKRGASGPGSLETTAGPLAEANRVYQTALDHLGDCLSAEVTAREKAEAEAKTAGVTGVPAVTEPATGQGEANAGAGAQTSAVAPPVGDPLLQP